MKDKIWLREMRLDDLELFSRWVYTPHVAIWYQQPQDWINEIRMQYSEFSWIHHFIVQHEENPIGFCQYYSCSDSNEQWLGQEIAGSYSIDYMIGEKEFLCRGFGKQIVAALMEKICKHEDACRIIVQPDNNNIASRMLLSACGFKADSSAGIYVKSLK